MFSLLDIVGTLLCGAQHINGLSPTSQFSPSGGVMDAPNSPGAPDELSLMNRLYWQRGSELERKEKERQLN